MRSTLPLGEMLVARGAVHTDVMQRAIDGQPRSGSRLGELLAAERGVCMLSLHEALAEQHGLSFLTLDDAEPGLAQPALLQEYIARRALPWRREGNTLIVATSEPCETLQRWAEETHGLPCHLGVATPYDIRRAIEAQFGHALTRESRNHLHKQNPEHSARITLTGEQRAVFGVLGIALAACAIYAPLAALRWAVVTLHALYFSTMLFKLLVFAASKKACTPAAPPPPDRALPIYTILVPLHHEAESLPHLMASLKRLDYPPAKLDIKLLLEADDTETWEAACALKLPWNVEIIRVPPSRPRTKPKALNYGLRFARGEFVTVYDAEDEPEPDQLKKVVAAFRALPRDVACLQARLNYYNAKDTWLTRCFALEYCALFGSMLPGLQALSIPMPLGGTSNHLHLKRLRQLGAWDPFNVTEDADLGVRLAAHGLKTAMLDSTTWEEAPMRTRAWMGQRSRWVKGYMQTWLVHMRQPVKLVRRVGWMSFFGLHYFVGMAPLTFLTAPLVWCVWLASLFAPLAVAGIGFPHWFSPLAWANLALHCAVHWLQAWRALPECRDYAENKWKFRSAALMYPLYWLLHSWAAWRALAQLIRRPHHWEKTAHGLAKRPPLPETAPLTASL